MKRQTSVSILNKVDRRTMLVGALSGAAVISLSWHKVLAAQPTAVGLQPGPLTPMLGSANGTRVLAVYFDYHCPFCRAMDPLLRVLVQRNPDLQILFKEFPILRLDSELAARIALSAQLRGRYFEVHDRLMSLSGDYTGAVATDIAQWLRVDPDPFRRDMGHPRVSAELEKNAQDALALGVVGTPALLTTKTVEQGGHTLAQLQALVDALAPRTSARSNVQ
ncbi:MAG TPA: DsbA family protein [Steroidobacteraceae bacterium]